MKWRAGSPERPAFAAMDGASKTPGSGTSCVWGGAAKYQPARNRKPRSVQRPVNWRETRGQETKNRALGPVSEDGGEDGDRTHDLIDANDALSQLSYPPTGLMDDTTRDRGWQKSHSCGIHFSQPVA